jgi:hypothetical protein
MFGTGRTAPQAGFSSELVLYRKLLADTLFDRQTFPCRFV